MQANISKCKQYKQYKQSIIMQAIANDDLMQAIVDGDFARVRQHAGRKVAANYVLAASTEGDLQIVEYLFERTLPIEWMIDECMCIAAGCGHVAVVRYMVEKGYADIYALKGKAIDLAAKYGHPDPEALRYLLSVADARSKSRAKAACVMAALRYGHEALVRSVDPGDVVRVHDCAIEAARSGCESLVRYVVELGADTRALLGMMWMGGRLRVPVMRYLIAGGADIYAWGGTSCINDAALFGNFELMRYLASIGVDARACVMQMWDAPPEDIIYYLIGRGAWPGKQNERIDLNRVRAASLLYFAWVPRCFDRGRRAGRRMARRNFRTFRRL